MKIDTCTLTAVQGGPLGYEDSHKLRILDLSLKNLSSVPAEMIAGLTSILSELDDYFF